MAQQQLSFSAFSGRYQQRRPEETILYQTVAKHYRTFEAITEASDKRLPKHVSQEFEAFLKCGILAHGFLRLRCEDCKHEKIVAFSCKKREFCSSCGGKRMAESAAHPVEEVFPKVGIRQWVLSFPMPVRFILAKNPVQMPRHRSSCHHRLHQEESKKERLASLPTTGSCNPDPTLWRRSES